MTAFADTPRSSALLPRLAAGFRAMGWFLGELFTAGPKVAALQRLSERSGNDLAARGTTREAELRRILGVGAAL